MTDSAPCIVPSQLAALLAGLRLRLIAFKPVPVRPRHDGWTPERQRRFILGLALAGRVAVAAEAVGMTRKSAYRLRRHAGAGSFAAAWDTALAVHAASMRGDRE